MPSVTFSQSWKFDILFTFFICFKLLICNTTFQTNPSTRLDISFAPSLVCIRISLSFSFSATKFTHFLSSPNYLQKSVFASRTCVAKESCVSFFIITLVTSIYFYFFPHELHLTLIFFSFTFPSFLDMIHSFKG